MADWKEQEFVSRRAHHARGDSPLEYMARKRTARTRVLSTVRVKPFVEGRGYAH